ncbi:hypothetical protein PSACC_02440 [Paramicrosporidium saccamoebae]|uniref:Uncharacterized protein n=1 Tax=Paramicrosporidium saccamoebae TaxID=1246581 RepID=A0A2H9TJD0_9FUNG|nr:hypothetical protein PSACC_02440 [Paramicrosporidium saccamoebae]
MATSENQTWNAFRKAMDEQFPDAYVGTLKLPNNVHSILPSKLRDTEDLSTLDRFASYFTKSDAGLAAVLLLAISEKFSSGLFQRLLVPRRDWVTPDLWGRILSKIRENSGDRFAEYYLAVLKCISYVEVLASYFSPAFDGITDEPVATIVRLTPFYYIIKKPDKHSEKLRKEFVSILVPTTTEPVSKYLPVLELYLQNSGYLKRAMSNEQDYFNLNKWVHSTFLNSSDAVGFIIENDLHNLAYIAFLPGFLSEHLDVALKKCAFKILSTFLSRNRPDSIKSRTKPCSRIAHLLNLYSSLSVVPNVVPCRPKEALSKLTELKLDFTFLRKFKDTEDIYTACHLLMGRLFEMPMDFISFEAWITEVDYPASLNDMLESYCDVYEMEPNFKIV